MSNRTFLIISDNVPDFNYFNEDSVACAASYMIPVFWYMLFNDNNITKTLALSEDEEEDDFEYDRLVAPKSEAILLAKQRQPIICNVFDIDPTPLFNQWLDYISSLPGKYILVETLELVIMDESPDSFTDQALNCIKAFSEEIAQETGNEKTRRHLGAKWTELLAQADIEDLGNFEDHHLAGYSWIKEIPWE